MILCALFWVLSAQDKLCGTYFEPCEICYDGYYDSKSEGCVQPRNLIPYCEFYASELVCGGCDPGYVLSDGICATLQLRNCYYASDAYTCSYCTPGTVNENGLCANSFIDIAHCLFATRMPNGEAMCQSCESGYALNAISNNCYPSPLTNCFLSAFDVCQQCNYGYYNDDGVCVDSEQQQRVRKDGSVWLAGPHLLLLFLWAVS